MKKLNVLTRMLLLVALLVGSVSMWGQAAKDDVLWSEPFKGSASTSTTFSETTNWGGFLNPTTLVASDASSLSYTTSNAMASGVTATEMSGTHVWLKKSEDAYIQVSGIKLYNATKVKVSWAQSTNGSSTTVYYQFDGSGDFTALSTCSGPNENFESNELTVSNHTTIALRFFHPSTNSKNTRIDNLKLTATAVETATVTSLTVKTAPTKTRYEVGESLDMTGFALNADGNTVTSGYTMTMGGSAITNGTTLSSAGKKTLVVSYGGKTVDQSISVGNVTGIAVTTPPTKTSYNTGDSFDATGMVVTATLNTGELESPDEWTKEVTGYTVNPEGALVPANTFVTITYATQTATQDITVTNVAVTGVSVKASTTIEKTKTETLIPTFTPTNATNKNVTWESDNTDVATVTAAGVVTAKAAGTANITVTTEDGGKTAICVVTVVNQKGTIDAPYTVAEVINGTATGNDKYVVGYIVGSYKSGSKSNFGRNGDADTNLAIADNPDEDDVDNTVAVQLPSGDLRNNFNVTAHLYYIGVIKVIVKADLISYITTMGLKNTEEISAVAEAVKVSSVGYGTWASDNKLDFTGTSIKAYKATVAGTTVNFTRVNVVPAGEGVLLYADGGASIEVPVTTTDADVFTGNKLVRGTGAAVTSAGEGETKNYVLSTNGAGDVNFYLANGNTVPANKAYLKNIPVAATSKIFLPTGEDETDGIRSIENSELRIENSDYYNLAGQKVGKDYKGIVIVNGKKMLNK